MWATAAPTWAKLQAFHAFVQSANAVAPISQEARDGNRTTLAFTGRSIDRLSLTGDLGRQLEAGTVTLQKWTEIANIAGEALNGVLQSFADEQYFGRFWTEVVVKSAEEGKQVIVDGAKGFGFGLGAATAAIAVLALVIFVRGLR